jgi:hypothetical protein
MRKAGAVSNGDLSTRAPLSRRGRRELVVAAKWRPHRRSLPARNLNAKSSEAHGDSRPEPGRGSASAGRVKPERECPVSRMSRRP